MRTMMSMDGAYKSQKNFFQGLCIKQQCKEYTKRILQCYSNIRDLQTKLVANFFNLYILNCEDIRIVSDTI